jgi:CRP-like cAMP-binding protein
VNRRPENTLTSCDFLAELNTIGMILRLAPGQILYQSGETANYCYLIVTGSLQTVRAMPDGRRHVTAFLCAGDFLGLGTLDQYDAAAETVSGAVLQRYSCGAINRIAAENARLALQLRELLTQRLSRAHDRLLLLGRKTATERLASFLLDMDRRLSRDPRGRIRLPRRADMADYLGLTMATISRLMRQLHESELISVDRGFVRIKNRGTLQQIADEA